MPIYPQIEINPRRQGRHRRPRPRRAPPLLRLLLVAVVVAIVLFTLTMITAQEARGGARYRDGRKAGTARRSVSQRLASRPLSPLLSRDHRPLRPPRIPLDIRNATKSLPWATKGIAVATKTPCFECARRGRRQPSAVSSFEIA